MQLSHNRVRFHSGTSDADSFQDVRSVPVTHNGQSARAWHPLKQIQYIIIAPAESDNYKCLTRLDESSGLLLMFLATNKFLY